MTDGQFWGFLLLATISMTTLAGWVMSRVRQPRRHDDLYEAVQRKRTLEAVGRLSNVDSRGRPLKVGVDVHASGCEPDVCCLCGLDDRDVWGGAV